MISGDIFVKSGKASVSHLGIQASPGTTFFLNGDNNPIQIGKTGIFEIDVTGYGTINSIILTETSLNTVNEDNGIIIDIIYEGGSYQWVASMVRWDGKTFSDSFIILL